MVLEEQLKLKEDELKESEEIDGSIAATGNETSEEEVQAISEPAKSNISEQDPSIFFDEVSISIVNINTDTDPYTALLTFSGNKSKQQTYKDLVVGDKRNYLHDGKVYEFTVSSMAVTSAGISVTKYQEAE